MTVDTADTTAQDVGSHVPRLRDDLVISRQRIRNEVWTIIEDPVAGRFFRFPQNTYDVLLLLDGVATLEQIAETNEQVDLPELVDLIQRLQNANLIAGLLEAPSDELVKHVRAERTRARRLTWLNPTGIKIKGVNPDPFLSRTMSLAAPFVHPYALVAYLCLILIASITFAMNAEQIGSFAAARWSSPRNIMALFILFPLVKLVHELAHGYTTKRLGGDVHEMGIMFLVFMPIPYIDTSSAHHFSQKSARIAVSMAGILAELVLASLALSVFLCIEPGIAKSIAFDVMVIGGVSTLLFNANPLLKFDGYYALSDFLEIPNLSERSRTYLLHLIAVKGLALTTPTCPTTAAGERRWFIGYGLCASLYRLSLVIVIAIFVAETFGKLGLALALWLIGYKVFTPLIKGFIFVHRAARADDQRYLKPLAVTYATAILVGFITVCVPLPVWTHVDGIVRIPETAMIRSKADGFVDRVHVKNGASVVHGEPIVTLKDPSLRLSLTQLELEIQEKTYARTRAITRDPREAARLLSELEVLATKRDDIDRRIEALQVTGQKSGRIEFASRDALADRYVTRGETVAYVLKDERPQVQIVIPQSKADRIRHATTGITLISRGAPAHVLAAELTAETPAASFELPSVRFGQMGGGKIAIDAREHSGRIALEQTFEFELAVIDPDSGLLPGERVRVRFAHPPQPLVSQLAFGIKQLFLSRLSV